jgi:hypothetical protein
MNPEKFQLFQEMKMSKKSLKIHLYKNQTIPAKKKRQMKPLE